MPFKDPEKAKQNKRDYYLKNRDTILVKRSIYYNSNKDILFKRRRKYDPDKQFRIFCNSYPIPVNLEEKKKKRAQYQREYNIKTNYRSAKKFRAMNPNKFKEYYSAHYKKNRILILKKCKDYRNKNKDKIRERQAKYYKKHGYGGCSRHSIEERISMTLRKKLDNASCQWQKCSKNHSNSIIDVHHIFPRNEYPELKERVEYMICYCREHHILWHESRGDIHVVNFLKGGLKKYKTEIMKPLLIMSAE